MSKRDLNLHIAVPSGGSWSARFGLSMIFMTAFLTNPIPGYRTQTFSVHNKRGSILPNMRQWLLMDALREGATHLLFIDSDQIFPKYTAHQLLYHDKPVVACNVATKQIPSSTTARLYDPEKPEGVPLYTRPGDEGLVQVWRAGTGVMMIDLSIFERMSMKRHRHFFPQEWKDERDSYQGEDWGFCQILEEAGVPIYVDQDLSLQIGHEGVLEYKHDLVPTEEQRRLYGEEEGQGQEEGVLSDAALRREEEESVLQAGYIPATV